MTRRQTRTASSASRGGKTLTLTDSRPAATHEDAKLPAGGRIENCKAIKRGGGLSVSGHTNGPVSVLDTVISGCEAENGGGVALIDFAELELGENARITGCTATEKNNTKAGNVEYGAAIYMDLDSLYL